MRILLTNDDGYRAPGLRALYDGLRELGEVIVAAPDRERSAVSLGITLIDPLRAWPLEESDEMRGWVINGTPADCVKLALGSLLDERPDLVVSGINQGTNVGLNANYSGTVAGAVEGTLNNIPALAVSLLSFGSRDFSGAVRATREVITRLREHPIEPLELLSINVPSMPAEQLKGLRVAPASHALFREVVERRSDARNVDYYWLGGQWHDIAPVAGGDHEVTQQGYAAVTPLRVDWTSLASIDRLRKGGFDLDWEEQA